MEVVTGIVADSALKFGCVTSVQVLIRIIGNSCVNASYYHHYNKYMCVCVCVRYGRSPEVHRPPAKCYCFEMKIVHV